ncbi:MAG: transaldolase [Candidatus Omnitrophica bacterium]|nr:transaldolase [Candidatus Omnitrophota bacterium]MBU2251414.1 transaldolase [Candidatus Omnitrophota bacterium]
MAETPIQKLANFGQSAWLDNINRSLLASGRLREMIAKGLRGLTSNPTIFQKAIGSSSTYDQNILKLTKSGKSVFEIYDELTIKDIQDAADEFSLVYKQTKSLDGYVSLEVSPLLANEAHKTLNEGLRLYNKVNRPNLMLKVPATQEGFTAVEELVSRGLNVNVTLIFSLEQYLGSCRAYLRGLKRFLNAGGDIQKVHSVASVFVSRVDTLVDTSLTEMITGISDPEKKQKLEQLKGKAAISNSSLIYKNYLDNLVSNEFKSLKEKGANVQRVLWASTSTKNPAYSDIKYVSELIAKNSVNTIPEETFLAFLDHGRVKEALTSDISKAQEVIKDLRGSGIDLNKVCAQLLKDGLAAFEKSFASLLSALEAKQKMLCSAAH